MSRLQQVILFKLLPPESKLEICLRTLYHRLTSTRIYVAWKLKASRLSYSRWSRLQSKRPFANNLDLSTYPTVSFLLPVEAPTQDAAVRTIKSIQSQRLSQWQVVLVVSERVPEPGFAEAFGSDSRVTIIRGEMQGLGQALAFATGQFIICCVPGDIFSSLLLDHFYILNSRMQDAAIYSYDHDEKADPVAPAHPFFKPSRLSPELLLSTDYLSSAIIAKKSAELVAPQIDLHLDITHQARELLFLLVEREVKILHIPQVLVHKNKSQDDDKQAEQVIRNHMARIGINGALIEQTGQGTRVRWNSELPPVSIIIPTKNNPRLLKRLLNSIFSLTQYANYEILLIDNNSNDPETLSYYATLVKDQKARIVPFNEPFNYSKAINLGAAHSQAELVLFLNNDMQVLQTDWLKELVQWALLPQIGVVGAKLLHPNRTVQHAGVVIGLQGFMGHTYLHAPENYYGLMGSLDWYRDVSAVPGACQMFRRGVFEELGGYDEEFQLIFSDIDICLRAIQKGYRILYDPFATLIHFEGHSRGYHRPLGDIVRGYAKMEDWLLLDDPYYSPNLTYTTIPSCQLRPQNENDRKARIEIRKEAALRAYERSKAR